MAAETADRADYRVVVNAEEQYSIWDATLPVPPGWTDAGHTGDRQSCLDHVEAVWTDMRPRSLRDGG
ncbi:MbtH family protein [Amycolatopsis sp. H20-H5]|uniref:MbtH family protein n=1 Tax=Amycolatopsis sp. H20-H5 TaxID=3046309 RepID=UPI002DB60DDF|nr:MbtH family NRPS accessory protein [Amycolatopsis sp. H20-H5]MEC3975018.1 MbtH family NRPS accessory protein [Amycolatopsis sp. H20-H5]